MESEYPPPFFGELKFSTRGIQCNGGHRAVCPSRCLASQPAILGASAWRTAEQQPLSWNRCSTLCKESLSQGLLHLSSACVWGLSSSFNKNAVDLSVSISSPTCKQQLCHHPPLIVRLVHSSFSDLATRWSRFQRFPSAFCCKAYLTHLIKSE